MNLINGEELEDVVTKLNEQGFGITRNEFKRIELVISEFPTVDAEPIVRCKDCKFYEIAELKSDYTEDKRCKPSVCVKGYYAKPRKESWYCADGVRRDEVTE